MDAEQKKDCEKVLIYDLKKANTRKEAKNIVARHNAVGKLIFGTAWEILKLEDYENVIQGYDEALTYLKQEEE